MRNRWMAVAACGLLLALWTTVPGAQDAQPEAPDSDLVVEVQNLNRSVGQLVSLLETAVSHQHIDLVLKRLQLKERRIAPLRDRVESAESAVNNREDELRRIKMMLEEHEETARERLRAGEEPDPEAQQMVDSLEPHVRILQRELEEYQLRLRTAEDDLARRLEEIEDLDEMLEELFE